MYGIVHMLQICAGWRDCPVAYAPYTTTYNRFNLEPARHLARHFWGLTGYSGVWGTVAIDSTHIKAH